MSRGSSKRDAIIEALNREMRNVTGQSVLYSQAAADRLGINPTDFECLGLLQQYGTMTAGRLAELTGLTTGAITGVVDRLEKGEFVQRESDPEDRRRVIIRMLPKREAEALGLTGSMQNAASALYDQYSDEQLAVILDFLSKGNKLGLEETLKLREGKPSRTREQDEDREFTAPLGDVTNGKLVFTSGTVMLNLRAEPSDDKLFRAHFGKPVPNVRTGRGTITVRYPRFQISDWLLSWRNHTAEFTLNKTIPWEIQLLSGVNKVNADLTQIILRSLEISGGVNETIIKLPTPPDRVPVPVKVAGGLNKVSIYRPEGVGIQASVPLGGRNLTLDGQHLPNTHENRWQSKGYESTRARFHLIITGGANDVTVATL
jgi:DNA-binding MarR family transcriptional regulator